MITSTFTGFAGRLLPALPDSGYAGVSLFHLTLILLVFRLTTLRMRLAHPPPWTYALLLLPTVIAVEIRFLDRPRNPVLGAA